jgi:hypothetical protein
MRPLIVIIIINKGIRDFRETRPELHSICVTISGLRIVNFKDEKRFLYIVYVERGVGTGRPALRVRYDTSTKQMQRQALKKYTINRRQQEATYAAVAAKTSCRLAFVHRLSAMENAIVNRKIINILTAPLSRVPNKAITGAMRSTTARMVITRRENMSMRFLS